MADYIDISTLFNMDIDYLDSDFQLTIDIDAEVSVFFLFPGHYTSYRSRFFYFIAVASDEKSVNFLFHYPDFEDWTFSAYLAEYTEFSFITYSPDFEEFSFLTYSPDFVESSFLFHYPDFEDWEFIYEQSEYTETNFRLVIPTDQFEDIGFIAQTLGRGSGFHGYEYDDFVFLNHVPEYLQFTFQMTTDEWGYLDRTFYAVFEGVYLDTAFLIHSDVTYEYVDSSFFIISVTDNLVEQASILVSSWVRRPGRRPAYL